MTDIFDAKISCKNCGVEMEHLLLLKRGFKIRTLKCPKCDDKIFHPADLQKLEQYNDLRNKTYSVKLRVVGNSHAISIPKEVVDFINATNGRMNKHMNDMVKLCFEDFGKLSLNFFDEEEIQKKW